MKVGADRANDLRRGKIIRSIIDDPQYLPEGHAARDPTSPELQGKNAGPTGAVLMIDANQVWDVKEAIDYVASLAEIKPWCVSRLLTSVHVLTHCIVGSLRSPLLRMTSWATLRSGRP